MSAHTKGPWMLVAYECSGIRHTVAGADGRDLSLFRRDDESTGGWHLREPDARLIAAAPDMLAALKELVSIEDGPGMAVIGWTAAMDAAIAAIAKAEPLPVRQSIDEE